MLMKGLEMTVCDEHKETCSKQSEHEKRLTEIERDLVYMEKSITKLEKVPEEIASLKATLHTWCIILSGLMTAVIFIFRTGAK